MPWKLVETHFNRHIVPVDDLIEHDYFNACWCGARTDYPHSKNVLHVAFKPMDEKEKDDINPDPPMTAH